MKTMLISYTDRAELSVKVLGLLVKRYISICLIHFGLLNEQNPKLFLLDIIPIVENN